MGRSNVAEKPIPDTGDGWLDNLIKRTLTGIPALVILLLLISFTHWTVLALIVTLAGVYGIYEFRGLMAGEPGIQLPLWPLAGGAAAIGLGALVGGMPWLTIMLVLSALFVMTGALMGRDEERLPSLRDAALSLFALVWIPWFLGHLILVARQPGGNDLIVFLVLVLAGNDTLAYLAGTLLGRRPLLPRISPKKTVEGALGGVIGGVIGGLAGAFWVLTGEAALPTLKLIALAAVLAIMAQAGDLLESMVKRSAGAKDSGSFLPGHGGFLDRLDAFLLASPFLYYFHILMV